MLIVSSFLLWIVVLLQTVALIAMARHIRAAGSGMGNVFRARRQGNGASRQQPLPAVPPERPDGVTLLIHMAENCILGRTLAEDAELMARAENMRLVLARDGQDGSAWIPPRGARPGARGPKGPPLRRRPAAQGAPLPHAMIIDGAGMIVAQSEVSGRTDLVHLLASVAPKRSPPAAGQGGRHAGQDGGGDGAGAAVSVT
ncbi:hypothetical protein GGR43_001736 [Sphingobium jiangsuense]|uniref:Uncharacterized protein n=1 Tax=Sphingobium jiangsuense TaxID=870476 RepID=A0A7W6FPE9_9SPHN|nr:hypothetical protein [Sphingobium jiangsuense]MBB3926021.1 hypothetical protein [Sphingobium jiangsuense]